MWIILLPFLLLLGFLTFNPHVPIGGQGIGISLVFLTLTGGIPGQTYTLTIKDSIDNFKDQIFVTPDSPLMNFNYYAPPGVTINVNDKVCSTATSCSYILAPDSFGTSRVSLSLS
jgi:hypothetical protein